MAQERQASLEKLKSDLEQGSLSPRRILAEAASSKSPKPAPSHSRSSSRSPPASERSPLATAALARAEGAVTEPGTAWRTAAFLEPKNDLILRAARGELTARSPVWLMRQAGRYDPQYQKLKQDYSFLEICRTPELAAEVAMQPVKGLGVDAAILFSDILVVPAAMGLELEHTQAGGPRFPSPLRGPEDLPRLRTRAETRPHLQYVLDAVRCTRHRLAGQVPLIGFAGGPWSLMAYMVQGGGLNAGKAEAFRKAKRWLMTDPDSAHALLARITDVVADFLVAQVEHGAQLLMVFDSHAGELGTHLYADFSARYLATVADRVKARFPEVPIGVFAKGAGFGLAELAATSFDIVQLDWKTTVGEARRLLPGKCLQGNLDPAALYAGSECVTRQVEAMMKEFQGGPHIVGMGDGCEPSMQPEALRHFVNEAQRCETSLYAAK